jgi:hypothetical protein
MSDKNDRLRGSLKRRRRISLSPWEWERLEALAMRTGRERSDLVAAMVRAAAARLLPPGADREAVG